MRPTGWTVAAAIGVLLEVEAVEVAAAGAAVDMLFSDWVEGDSGFSRFLKSTAEVDWCM